MCYLLYCVPLCATPWTVACQAPLSTGFSRQDIGVGCHFLPQGSSRPRDPPSTSRTDGNSLRSEPPGKPSGTLSSNGSRKKFSVLFGTLSGSLGCSRYESPARCYLPHRRPTPFHRPRRLCACPPLWSFSSSSMLSSRPGPSSVAPPFLPLAGQELLPSLLPGRSGHDASLDVAVTRSPQTCDGRGEHTRRSATPRRPGRVGWGGAKSHLFRPLRSCISSLYYVSQDPQEWLTSKKENIYKTGPESSGGAHVPTTRLRQSGSFIIFFVYFSNF